MKIAFVILGRSGHGGHHTWHCHIRDLFSQYAKSHDVEFQIFVVSGVNRVSKVYNGWGDATYVNYRNQSSIEALAAYDFVHFLSVGDFMEKNLKEPPQYWKACEWVMDRKPFTVSVHGPYDYHYNPQNVSRFAVHKNFIGWHLTKPDMLKEILTEWQLPVGRSLYRPIFLSKIRDSFPEAPKTKITFHGRFASVKGTNDVAKFCKYWKSIPLEIWGEGMGIEHAKFKKQLEALDYNNPWVDYRGKFDISQIDDFLLNSMFGFDLSTFDNRQGIQFVELEMFNNGTIPIIYDQVNLQNVSNLNAIVLERIPAMANPKQMVENLLDAIVDFGSSWADIPYYNYQLLNSYYSGENVFLEFLDYYKVFI